MKAQQRSRRLLETSSMLALSTAAVIGLVAPGSAQEAAATAKITTGVYGGGSTLASETVRQLFDCYMGLTVGSDTFTFSSSFTTTQPSPGLLPTTCKTATHKNAVEGMYASVGSGAGQRGYISNDPQQLLQTGLLLPNAQPPFIDSNNAANFGTYPYPRIDFGASDSPLASAVSSLTTVSFSGFTPTNNWQTLPPTQTTVTAASSTTVTYSAGNFGVPVQIPLFEAPVAIIVDTTNPTNPANNWQIQSSQSPTTQPGGAIQLSIAQMCAIFSGLVTDWNDTATLIPRLDKHGTSLTQAFSDDNTDGTLTPISYIVSGGSLPIVVTYRSDGSGTSFIITNFLKSSCPLLDPTDAFKYQSIFNASGLLPTTSFSNLVAKVKAIRGGVVANNWVGASGSGSVAINVGTAAAQAGAIGYVSSDFSEPYATQVTGVLGGTTQTLPAPLSASLQDEHLRTIGVYHPGTVFGGLKRNFIAPTPTNVDAAFVLTNVATSATYNDWNLYGQVYASGTISGGVNIGGLSKLGIATAVNAYPVSGTTFAFAYSCYADAAGTRVPAFKNALAWLLGGSVATLPHYNSGVNNASNPGFDADVRNILRNQGFHELHSTLADNLLKEYVIPSSVSGLATAPIAAFVSGGPQIDGCTGVTGTGAN